MTLSVVGSLRGGPHYLRPLVRVPRGISSPRAGLLMINNNGLGSKQQSMTIVMDATAEVKSQKDSGSDLLVRFCVFLHRL